MAKRNKKMYGVPMKTQIDNVEITRDDFMAFADVRRSGEYNMLTEAKAARDMAGLSKAKWFAIIKQYGHNENKYKENK